MKAGKLTRIAWLAGSLYLLFLSLMAQSAESPNVSCKTAKRARDPERVPWKQTGPTLIGHRGLLHFAPENTLAGFSACVDLKLGFEMDVRRTKDGQLVSFHDDNVKRTTGQAGLISEMTLAEIKNLDIGKSFDPAFAGEKIPTVEEVFLMLKQRQNETTLVALDFKSADDDTLKQTVNLVVKHGLLKQVVCIGKAIDDAEVRKKLKAVDAKIPVAVLAQTTDDFDKALADKNADWAYTRFLPTADQVTKAHQAEKRVFMVGPLVAGQEVDNWKKARDAGVDAMLTDYPLECRQSWRPKP